MEGNVRILREKVIAGELSREEAAQMIGKDVFEAQGAVPKMLWPTPTAMTGGQGVAPSHINGKHGWNLGAAVQDSLSEKPNRLWPTPAARDGKGGYIGGRIRNGKVSWDTLDVAVQWTDNQQKTGGQLNPQWVEWLMGFPIGWTDLNNSETP
jgi:hypothetical protein